MASIWGLTLRESIGAACHRLGEKNVVDSCVRIINDRDMDAEFGFVLSGPHSQAVLNGAEGGVSGRWPRTWALRALLYAWDSCAEPAVLVCLDDDSWRVREMAAKVVARRHLGDALYHVAALQNDEVPRVRAAAQRAITTLVEGDD
jgi:hypothetical protein